MSPDGHRSPEGRFTEGPLRHALAALCEAGGLDGRDARPLKLTNNAVFHLPHAGVVVRVTTTAALHHRVPKIVAVARWLADIGIPAVRLHPGVLQPLSAGGFLATVWGHIPATGPRPGAGDLGRLLVRLHAAGPAPFDLPPWNAVDDARRRLADADGLPDEDLGYLIGWADHLAGELDMLDPALPVGPVHGDAHTGNLVRDPAGTALLLDFDGFSHGPREWDLTPAALGAVRFRNPQGHRDLVKTYGFDVTAWSGWPTLRAVRELQLVTSAVPMLTSNPAVATQHAHRLRSIRSGDTEAVWTPYR